MEKIPLAQLVAHVRTELRKLHDSTLDPVMKFTDCELEFAVQVECQKSGELSIYLAKASGNQKDTVSHKIRIKYTATAILAAELSHVGKSVPKPVRQKKGAKPDA